MDPRWKSCYPSSAAPARPRASAEKPRKIKVLESVVDVAALQHADAEEGGVRAARPDERAHVCLRPDGLRLRPYRQRAAGHRVRRAVPAAAPTYGEIHVTYVRNITDVDDKIMRARRAENKRADRRADRTHRRRRIHDDMAALGALPPDVEPRATESHPADGRDDRDADRARQCLCGRRPCAVQRAIEARLRQAVRPLARRDDRRRPRRRGALQEGPDGFRAVEAEHAGPAGLG